MYLLLKIMILAIGFYMVRSSLRFIIKNKKQDFTMLFSGLFVLLMFYYI